MGGDDGGGDGTHRNATQFVVSQSTSRQQVVFASQVVNMSLEQLVTSLTGILEGCPNNSDADLLYKIVTKLTTQGCNNIVIS